MEEQAAASEEVEEHGDHEGADSPAPFHIDFERLPRRAFGYEQRATAALFSEVAATYELLWREHRDLTERAAPLEGELADARRRGADATESVRELKSELERVHDSERTLEAELEQAQAQLQRSEKRERELAERASALEASLDRSQGGQDGELEAELERLREKEHSVAEALIWASEQAAARAQRAEKDAEELLAEARLEARKLLRGAESELVALEEERRRLETLTSELQDDLSSFLLSSLERVKAKADGSAGEHAEAGPAHENGQSDEASVTGLAGRRKPPRSAAS